jgi:hypothetical protein
MMIVKESEQVTLQHLAVAMIGLSRTAGPIDESGKRFRNKIPETLRPYSLCNG